MVGEDIHHQWIVIAVTVVAVVAVGLPSTLTIVVCFSLMSLLQFHKVFAPKSLFDSSLIMQF
jgi:hypothetical protein